MVRDAEANADEDRKFHELVTVRNNADNLLHSTRKSLSEMGEKVPAADRAKIESAIADLEKVLKGDDKNAIESRANALSEASGALHTQGQPQDGGADGQAGSESSGQSQSQAGDDAIDAEFEEVKDKK